MGRRCKKCERILADRNATFCPPCEIDAILPSDETDAEFSKLFEEYHGGKITGDVLDGDIFRQKERLNSLVYTAENKVELERLESFQKLIEDRKEKLKNKLLLKAISADINKKLSPKKLNLPSPLASPKIASPLSINWEENCTSPRKEVFDHNSNVISETPLSSTALLGLRSTQVEIKKGLMDFNENDIDEIDGNCIFKAVVVKEEADENEEDQDRALRKVVRRRSSVKDRIKAFEMLNKRFTL